MGYDFVRDLRDAFPEDMALRYHFIYNHSPRLSLEFLAVAKDALQLARKGDFTTKLKLPTGEPLSVAKIVDELDLQAFIDEERPENGGQ